MGITHHSAYIIYFGEARTHSRERGASYADFERSIPDGG